MKRCEGCGCMRSHSFRRLSWRPSTARIRSPTASTPEEERAAGCEHGRRVGGVRRAGGARRAGGGRRGRLLGCGRRRTDARRVLFDRDDHVEVVEPDAERAVAAVHTQRHRRVLRRAPLAARTRLAARRRHPATAAAASGDHHSARVVLRARRRAARDSRGVTAADGQVVARLGWVDREPVQGRRRGDERRGGEARLIDGGRAGGRVKLTAAACRPRGCRRSRGWHRPRPPPRPGWDRGSPRRRRQTRRAAPPVQREGAVEAGC